MDFKEKYNAYDDRIITSSFGWKREPIICPTCKNTGEIIVPRGRIDYNSMCPDCKFERKTFRWFVLRS